MILVEIIGNSHPRSCKSSFYETVYFQLYIVPMVLYDNQDQRVQNKSPQICHFGMRIILS